jgi:dipeptidyl aminopeptidase/acylaminoacyl peptidase
VLVLALAAALIAAPPPPVRVHLYERLTIAPAGDRVAAVESLQAEGGAAPAHGTLVVRSARDGRVLRRFDPCRTCTYTAPAFSPDGRRRAFLASDAKAGTVSLDVAEGATVRALTTIGGVASTVRWSPDGTALALLVTVGARKQTGATQPGVPEVGEIGAGPDEQRVALVGPSGGPPRLVSPPDLFVYEYDWTPDGRGFVASAARGNGDANWWVARLDAIDARGGAVREIAAPATQLASPRVSPDGRSVAFVGGLMSDFGSTGGDLYTVPFAGGAPADVTASFKASFNGVVWDGDTLLGTALSASRAILVRVDPATRTTSTLRAQAVSLSASDGRIAFSADRRVMATVAQDFSYAPYIMVGGPRDMREITADNEALPEPVRAQSVDWTNDGFDVQGWLLAPPAPPPGVKHPMVVLIHGGPGAAWTPRYEARGTVYDLIARGYYVFEPNPRGSFGQGEPFARAVVRDFGGGDLRDILTGVDAVEKLAPVDDARLGIAGHSYGGYMTMWAVTRTNRFRAAAAGAGVANWISYYGQNGIDQWMLPFFGASAYDDPAIYRAASPIEHIKDARTPTFVYVGERDVECPPAQSLEFWHGLRAMNVPSTLIVYPGEGHAIRRPDHQRDVTARIGAWFERYLR